MENDFFSIFWYWKSGTFFPKISKIVKFTLEGEKKKLQKNFPFFFLQKNKISANWYLNKPRKFLNKRKKEKEKENINFYHWIFWGK